MPSIEVSFFESREDRTTVDGDAFLPTTHAFNRGEVFQEP
jgi:hypothetical protein